MKHITTNTTEEILGSCIGLVIYFFGMTWIVQWAINMLLPIWELSPITYWQAMAAFIVFNLVGAAFSRVGTK